MVSVDRELHALATRAIEHTHIDHMDVLES